MKTMVMYRSAPSFRYQENTHCSLAVASTGVSGDSNLERGIKHFIGVYLRH